MTYQPGGNYVLAEKLKKEFYGRGQNLRGVRASSTSELVRRASMGRDPRENCSEEAFRESFRNQKENRTSYTNNIGTARREDQSRKNYNSSGNAAYRSASAGRAKTESAKRCTRENAGSVAHRKEEKKITPAPELKLKSKFLSPMFIISLLIGTVMVMFLVFNISETYEMINKVSQLESDLDDLESVAEQLELRLEEKNDIREIENIATSKLGMVKEDSLQRRYISLSEGEHIEVFEESSDEKTSGGVLLSSVFSSLDKFFERFK